MQKIIIRRLHMKLLLILVLAALIVGCVKTTPEETIPDKPDTVSETNPITETIAESTPETHTEESIPVMPDPVPSDTPYTGELFYFTKVPSAESEEPENTYRALAVLAFDFTDLPSNWWENNYNNTLISYSDEQPRIDSVEYLRMETDGVVHPTDESKFTSPNGYTADGKPFSWEIQTYPHPEIVETVTEYTTYIRLNDEKMLCLSFYSYTYFHDEDFVNNFLLPKLSTCRTWTPDMPLKLLFTTNSVYQEEPSSNYHITLTLPDSWQWNNSSVADDTERMYTGRYSVKRMEFYPVTYTEPFKGYMQFQSKGIPDPITGTTDEGLPYEIYVYSGFSEGEPLEVTWYFANIGYDGRYIQISFLTFEDDPVDYFDTVTLPVIKSVHIETAQ